MSMRWIRFGLLAVTVAVAAMLFAELIAPDTADTHRPTSKSQTRPNMVAKLVRPVERGSMIAAADLQFEPGSAPLPSGAVTRISETDRRVAVRDIKLGEILSQDNSTTNSAAAGLARLIPEGYRAVAIQVSDEIAVGNLIRPDDRVDILLISSATRSSQDGNRRFPDAEARVLFENIRVLAVGPSVVGNVPEKPVYQSVTLAVTPQQAASLALAHAVGTYYLSLRGTGDQTLGSTISVRTEDLGPAARSPERTASAEPHADTRVVEVIAGNNRSHEVVLRHSTD